MSPSHWHGRARLPTLPTPPQISIHLNSPTFSIAYEVDPRRLNLLQNPAMDDQAEIETYSLKRILALLFSLALSAERAASRSYPVRCFVLWVLRRAEPYAWSCIMRKCGYDAGAPMPRSLRTPLLLVILNTPADALRIAATYRALARALQKQLRRDELVANLLSRRDDDWIDLVWGKLDWLASFADFPPASDEPTFPALFPSIALAPDTS